MLIMKEDKTLTSAFNIMKGKYKDTSKVDFIQSYICKNGIHIDVSRIDKKSTNKEFEFVCTLKVSTVEENVYLKNFKELIYLLISMGPKTECKGVSGE